MAPKNQAIPDAQTPQPAVPATQVAAAATIAPSTPARGRLSFLSLAAQPMGLSSLNHIAAPTPAAHGSVLTLAQQFAAASDVEDSSDNEVEDEEDQSVIETPCLKKKNQAGEMRFREITSFSEWLKRSMQLSNYFDHDQLQNNPIVTWAWTDGESGMLYITVQIELLGTTMAKDITARVVNDGHDVEVLVNIPEEGEILEPDHLLLWNLDYDQHNCNHAQYAGLSRAKKAMASHLNDEDEVIKLFIELPFECKLKFINPYARANDPGLHIGNYPLNKKQYRNIGNGPPPSVQLLHISLEERGTPQTGVNPLKESMF